MGGEISRQRRAIAQHLGQVEDRTSPLLPPERQGKAATKRQRAIMDYLEGLFSEEAIRRFYALYLWGYSWRCDYDLCPAFYKAAAENAPYEEVICKLISNWRAFKQAPGPEAIPIQETTA